MHLAATQVANELEAINTTLNSLGITLDQPFDQMFGWNMPSISIADLKELIVAAQNALTRTPDSIVDPSIPPALIRLATQMTHFRATALPNLGGANALHVVPSLLQLIARAREISVRITPALLPPPPPPPDWEKLASQGLLPKNVVRRLQAMTARVDQLAPDIDELQERMNTIRDASDTADLLPESMATLERGAREVERSRAEAQSLAADAATHAREAADYAEAVHKLTEQAKAKSADLDDAFRAVATKGLASAFQTKAGELKTSLRYWVGLLIVDLMAGVAVGYFRFAQLEKVLTTAQTPATVWSNLVLSLLSVAAPIWLGWVATKQINQRFRLAEDYGFKATVASAYEAWKNEAARQDEEFEHRLFGSALSRLEEPPLRFLNKDDFGSPWHELLSSEPFRKALTAVPELGATVGSALAGAGGAAAGALAVLKGVVSKAATKDGSDSESPPSN